MVAALGSGPLRIRRADRTIAEYVSRGGFLEVSENEVTILVRNAETEAEVDVEGARRDLDASVEALGQRLSDAEFGEFQDRRAWSQARLNLAKE
jgi:F0F1-type ATP synthase epsilon subunit